MDVKVSPDAQRAAHDAASFIARRVWPAVRRRGRFDLALSGGSTPALMFADLSQRDLPWGSVHLYQVDERVAADGADARNANLLEVFDVPSENRHLMEVTWADARLAVASYAAGLPPQLDLVHLGLGDDGHTASWPPGDPVVDALVPVARVEEFNGYERMTLTPLAVNAARTRMLLITDEHRGPVLQKWLSGDESLPVHRVKRTRTTIFTDLEPG